jgi:hypothetical protein
MNNTQWSAGNYVDYGGFESVNRIVIKTGGRVTFNTEYNEERRASESFGVLLVP